MYRRLHCGIDVHVEGAKRMMRSLLRRFVPHVALRAPRFGKRVLDWSGGRVGSGLFAGMPYIDESHGSVFLPKVLGTYELELVPLVARWSNDQFRRIIVAGAAEGYYAVGLARRFPNASVVAFEPFSAAREALFQLAQRNECAHRIQVRGICHCSALAQAFADEVSTLLLVDIEGGEALLLDPKIVADLTRSTMLVEVHEFAFPGIEALLRERFTVSHRISRVDARERTVEDLPAELRVDLPKSFMGVAVQAMNERRPPGMFWLLFEPITEIDTQGSSFAMAMNVRAEVTRETA
jgi:hypothetical protein